MASGTFSWTIEVGFAGLGVTHQRIDVAGSCGAAAHRHAVNKGCDGRNVLGRKIKFWHAFIGAAVLNDNRYQFTVVIVQHQLTADQIGASFAAPSIRSVAKTAICAENLAAARNHSRVGRRPDWISRRTDRWGRGCRSCLVGTGFLRWSGSG